MFSMADKDLVEKLRNKQRVMTTLTARIMVTMGNLSSWDATMIRKAKHILGLMTAKDLKLLKKDTIRAALADLNKVEFKRPDLKAAMTSKVIEALGGRENATAWTSDDIIK